MTDDDALSAFARGLFGTELDAEPPDPDPDLDSETERRQFAHDLFTDNTRSTE